MTDGTTIAIAYILEVAYWLATGIFTFDLGQDQGHAYFDFKYIVNGSK